LLHEDGCVDDCPGGYFASEQECVRCYGDCARCDGPDPDDCLACRNPRAVLHNGECLGECPSRTFHDQGSGECLGERKGKGYDPIPNVPDVP